MVKLRLKRMGKKRNAIYRIVASDSRVQRDGKYIELLGNYNPLKKETKINKELTKKWLFNGAQPTDTVRNILSENGILKNFHEEKMLNKKTNQKNKKQLKQITKTNVSSVISN